MTEEQIAVAIEDYEECESIIARQRASRWCQQSEIVRQESRMARIEERFQRAGLDINQYL